MKRIHTIALALFAGLIIGSFSACRLNCVHGSGHRESETRKLGEFTSISIAGGYKVNLVQDSSLSVKITADDNLLKYIKTQLDGDRLKIYSRRSFCNTSQITLNIGVKNLDEIKAAGGVEIVGSGKINTKDIHFKLAGATRITMDLNAANVTTNGSGDTELNLSGQASSHEVHLAGNGEIKALDFVVGDYKISTAGMAHCEINVLHTLDISSTGDSEIKYRGNPTNISNHKLGASSLEKVN